MRLSDLTPAIQRVLARPALLDLRAAAYLATYPHLRGHVAPGTSISTSTFLQLATLAYGWMPRVLRIDLQHLTAATTALHAAAGATASTFSNVSHQDIACCLRSVVGASKMLHFVNDRVFPIWDSKIETVRLRGEPTHTHMSDPANYLAYVRDVHSIRSEPGFKSFYVDFQSAYTARQRAMGITSYTISEVRAIEAAAFELA